MSWKPVIAGGVQIPTSGGGGLTNPLTETLDFGGNDAKNLGIIYAADGVTPLIDLASSVYNPLAFLSFNPPASYAYFNLTELVVTGNQQLQGSLQVIGATSLANGACTIDGSGNLECVNLISTGDTNIASTILTMEILPTTDPHNAGQIYVAPVTFALTQSQG